MTVHVDCAKIILPGLNFLTYENTKVNFKYFVNICLCYFTFLFVLFLVFQLFPLFVFILYRSLLLSFCSIVGGRALTLISIPLVS